jgi:hypothetical protein
MGSAFAVSTKESPTGICNAANALCDDSQNAQLLSLDTYATINSRSPRERLLSPLQQHFGELV